MSVSRREFIKYCATLSGALGLASSDLVRLGEVLAGPASPRVVWLNGASCSGCSVSLLNLVADDGPRDVAELLIDWVNLSFHPTLMDAAGDLAVSRLERAFSQSGYILAVEGGVPTGFGGAACWAYSHNGEEVTFAETVTRLASRAWAIVSMGSCAGWGGIPAAGTNPTSVVGVGEFTGKPVVNIAGCPPHPDWMVWAMAQLILGNTIDVDEFGRPTALFERRVHQDCPLKRAPKATTMGVPGECLQDLGCRGQFTYAPCPVSRWNNGVSWCVEAGGPCIGCTEPTYPSEQPFHVGLNSAPSPPMESSSDLETDRVDPQKRYDDSREKESQPKLRSSSRR
jgi:hydrogenase small subunit